MEKEARKERRFSTSKMVMTGILGAVSAILMILEFPVPIAPGFIKMDFSDFPIILGGYLMGPLAGFFIILIKILLNFILSGTTTVGVGEVANFIYSVSYMLPAVLIYKKIHTKAGAVISLAAGTIVAAGVAFVANYTFIFPAYAKLFGISLDSIIGMGTAINGNITDLFTLMLFSILPFNLFKYGCISVITFFGYKRLSRFWKRID